MMYNKGRLKTVSGITTALLLCAFLCSLRTQHDTRSREEVAEACEEKVERSKKESSAWASEGREPIEIHDITHAEFFPHIPDVPQSWKTE